MINILENTEEYNKFKNNIYSQIYYSFLTESKESSQNRINKSINYHKNYLIENSMDYESVLIVEMAKRIREKDPSISAEDALMISEGFFDSVVKKLGQAAQKLGKTFNPSSNIDWEQQAKTIGLDDEYEKMTQQASEKISSKLLNQIGSQSKDIDSGLGQKNSYAFPLTATKEAFFQGVIDIAAFYDSLQKDAEQNPGKASAYNEIVNDLKLAIDKYINDVNTKDGGVYRYFSGGDASKYSQNEQVEKRSGEDVDSASGRGASAIGSAEGEDHQDAKFLSVKGPIIVAIAGVLATFLGADLAKEVADNITSNILSSEDITGASGNIKDKPSLKEFGKKIFSVVNNESITVGRGDSLMSVMDSLSGGSSGLTQNPTVGELVSFFQSQGGGNVTSGIESFSQNFSNPSAASEIFSRIEGLDPNSSVWGSVFSGPDGLGEAGELMLQPGQVIPSTSRIEIVKIIARNLLSVAAKSGAKKAAATGVGAASLSASAIAAPLLAFLGIGAVTSGLAVAGLRQYAKTNSRLATLNQLSKLIKPFPEKG